MDDKSHLGEPATAGAADPSRAPGGWTNPQAMRPGWGGMRGMSALLSLVALVMVIRWSIASPYYVPTSSMEPTIKVGDRLLAFKLAYGLRVPFTDLTVASWSKPRKGDIIVFRYPGNPKVDFVKRVVAVSGDELRIEADTLVINGEAQPKTEDERSRAILDDIYDNKDLKVLYRENLAGLEHWVMQDRPEARKFARPDWPAPGSPPYRVPENSVFCVGDNRDNSTDSRVWHHVPVDYVRGKALFVIWSYYNPKGADWPVFRWNRFGKWLYGD